MSCKNGKFLWKKSNIFNIFVQNIDCGYTLVHLPGFVGLNTLLREGLSDPEFYGDFGLQI